MSLDIIYDFNWERGVRACYAEKKDNIFVNNIIAQINNLIQNNCYFYKVENKQNGTMIGFIIYKGDGVPTPTYNGDMIPMFSYIRPQFISIPNINNEFQTLSITTINRN